MIGDYSCEKSAFVQFALVIGFAICSEFRFKSITRYSMNHDDLWGEGRIIWMCLFLSLLMNFIIDDALFRQYAVVVCILHQTECMRVLGGYLDPVMGCRLHHAINGGWALINAINLIFVVSSEFHH